MSDEGSSPPAKVPKLTHPCDQPVVDDALVHPIEWDSHVNGIAGDEAAFFAGWSAVRQKFSMALRQDFTEAQSKDCETVFNSLTFVFLRHRFVSADCSRAATHVPLLNIQPWFCRVLHSFAFPAAPGGLQFSERVATELRQVLKNALLELTQVNNIWTFKKSRADRETVVGILHRLRDMGVCNVDGADLIELERCAAGAEHEAAEQVQKRCHNYASTTGLVPYIDRSFDLFCGLWINSDVSDAVVKVLQNCRHDCPAPAILRVHCCDDMFTLSLERSKSSASASDTAIASRAACAGDDSEMLCPSFRVHRSRLALLRDTYVLQFEMTSFYERVMACLLRYKVVFHPNGGSWQAAQPHGIFRLWADRLGACIECFASPMNRNVSYPRYFSAFGDVDSPFGSSGSFFDNPPESGICFASPPFESDFLSAATAAIVDAARRGCGKVAYIVSLPDWKRGSSSHSRIEAQCDRLDLPSGRGVKCNFMVYNQGQITMTSAVAADRVGQQQSYTFGIRFYALGFKTMKPGQKVDYDLLQRDMRKVFECGK